MNDLEAARLVAKESLQAAQQAKKMLKGIDVASLTASVQAGNEAMKSIQAMSFLDMGPIRLPKQGAMMLYDKIREHIEDAEQTLQPDEQLSVQCSIAGDGPFVVQQLGYHGIDLLIVYGVDGAGNECEVLVHPHSIQFVIRKIKSDGRPKRSIGFKNEV